MSPLGLPTVPVFASLMGPVNGSPSCPVLALADEINGTATGRQNCCPPRQRATVGSLIRVGMNSLHAREDFGKFGSSKSIPSRIGHFTPYRQRENVENNALVSGKIY
ncbi:hypothetical protein DFH09DRAFT_1088620 [Mycena vulgaris]|nr:hypothetical protein DFH09DRAFT_1088620 [Mycena vulgaris]